MRVRVRVHVCVLCVRVHMCVSWLQDICSGDTLSLGPSLGAPVGLRILRKSGQLLQPRWWIGILAH